MVDMGAMEATPRILVALPVDFTGQVAAEI